MRRGCAAKPREGSGHHAASASQDGVGVDKNEEGLGIMKRNEGGFWA